MKDFIIDVETLGITPDAIVVDISVLVFDLNDKKIPSFNKLVECGRRFKLSIESQKGIRKTTRATVDWWKSQDAEARKHLLPSKDDLTIEQALQSIESFLDEMGVVKSKSHGWCRGMSFDFPILSSLMRNVLGTDEIVELELCRYYNQRDIRTAFEAYALVRNMTSIPLPEGALDGYVPHDSIHDCAKDALMLMHARAYAMGILSVPENENDD